MLISDISTNRSAISDLQQHNNLSNHLATVNNTQIYFGPRRGKTDVIRNRSIVKELHIGMMVAVAGEGAIPMIGEVVAIPPTQNNGV